MTETAIITLIEVREPNHCLSITQFQLNSQTKLSHTVISLPDTTGHNNAPGKTEMAQKPEIHVFALVSIYIVFRSCKCNTSSGLVQNCQ